MKSLTTYDWGFAWWWVWVGVHTWYCGLQLCPAFFQREIVGLLPEITGDSEQVVRFVTFCIFWQCAVGRSLALHQPYPCRFLSFFSARITFRSASMSYPPSRSLACLVGLRPGPTGRSAGRAPDGGGSAERARGRRLMPHGAGAGGAVRNVPAALCAARAHRGGDARARGGATCGAAG